MCLFFSSAEEANLKQMARQKELNMWSTSLRIGTI